MSLLSRVNLLISFTRPYSAILSQQTLIFTMVRRIIGPSFKALPASGTGLPMSSQASITQLKAGGWCKVLKWFSDHAWRHSRRVLVLPSWITTVKPASEIVIFGEVSCYMAASGLRNLGKPPDRTRNCYRAQAFIKIVWRSCMPCF